MPLPTFTPSIAPSPGATLAPEIRLRTTEFGDGYSQDAPAGLNHIRKVISLRWNGVTLAQVQELEAFFEGQQGTRPFYFQPYGSAAPIKWTCREWSANYSTPHTFTATLRQSFTLEG